MTNKELMKQLWPKQKKQKLERSPLLRSTNSLWSPGSSTKGGGRQLESQQSITS